MSTLYRPVLIESAEQAEALPEGAVVINRDSGDKYHRGLDGTWWSDHDMGGPLSMDLEYDAIEALVPIEVRVEGHRIYEGAKTIEATYYIREETP